MDADIRDYSDGWYKDRPRGRITCTVCEKRLSDRKHDGKASDEKGPIYWCDRCATAEGLDEEG
jgi:hypothetical protein